ncbi:hypothetical protein PGTUg99_023476 [Puccinia graminis f. sp. tritici]|uniref:Uncharacterized protein n=1 Tax=Puccinia graminis f. sp. tritici TaxID=56615 RepID=A0A5B0MHD3_PUCGR|nr:hypothetical protein PGTUg99_023476 [Puccinia graminis f. sp. tritici]
MSSRAAELLKYQSLVLSGTHEAVTQVAEVSERRYPQLHKDRIATHGSIDSTSSYNASEHLRSTIM